MIKQKTIVLGTTTGPNSGVSLSFEAIQDVVNKAADELLKEMDDLGHAFISLQISHMPEGNRHLDRIFITVVYRYTPTRKVITEKSKTLFS